MRTLQVLIAACLVSCAFTATVKIGYVAESGDPITFQTSTWSLSFQWEADSITDPEYAIGIAGNVEKYLAYTVDSTFSGTSTAGAYHSVSVSSLAFEAEDDVIVTFRSQLTPAESATSSSVKVGSAQRFSCPSFFNPEPILGGTKYTPADPSVVDVTWDADNSMMKFEVTVEYLQWGYTWFVDFNPFLADSTKGQNGFAYGSCENKVAAKLTGRNFADFFNAAPAADAADANGGTPFPLNNDNYLAYQHTGSRWVATAVDCHTVKFTASFLPSELAACTDGASGSPISVDSDTTTPSAIAYTGTLYVAGVRARDTTDASQGFEVTTFQYPFEFDFNMVAEAVLGGDTSLTLTYTIDKVYLVPASSNSYYLHMQLSTDTHDSSFFLASGSVTAQPSGVNLGFVAPSPSATQQQVWQLQSGIAKAAGSGNNFDGTYSFSWTRDTNPSSTPSTESISINIKMTVVPKVTNLGALVVSLDFADDVTFTNPAAAAVYVRQDTIYIRSVVMTKDSSNSIIALPSSQRDQFKNHIRNVWICWTGNNLPPANCQTATANVHPIGQLVVSGTPVAGSSIAGQFQTHTYTNVPYGIHAGMSMLAQPLLSIHPGKFYIEVQSRITDPNGSKRTVTTVSNVDRTKSTSFDFYDSVSGAAEVAPKLILLAVASMVAILLL